MRAKLGTLGLCALLLASLFVGEILPAQTVSLVDTCLACHGPFDKLVAATSGYTWKSGEAQSPHRYVPHDSKTIAECTNCHRPHPVPPSASDITAMAKPNPQYCYECHHTQTFACGTCHPIER